MKIKITTSEQVKTKIAEWKLAQNIIDELIYNPSDIDGKDIQLDAFKTGVLISISQLNDTPFNKIVFTEVLNEIG